MRTTSRRAWRVIGGGVGAATLLGLGYVATQWLRYGHVRKRRGPPTRLDRFLPECEVLEQHQTRVAVPADVTFGAVTQPWKSHVKFRGLPPDEFAAFDKPGFAKIAWTILAEPLGYHRPVAIPAEEGWAPKLDESPTRSGTFADSAIDGRDLTWVPDPSRRSCVTAFPHRLRDELRTDRENRRTHGRSADGLGRGGDARQRVQPPA